MAIIAKETGHQVEYIWLGACYVYMLSSVFVIIFITISSFRTLHDNIHLRGEILWGSVLLLVYMFIGFVVQIIDGVQYSVENERYQQIFFFVMMVTASVIYFALIVVSTQYVRYWENWIAKGKSEFGIEPEVPKTFELQRSPTVANEMSSLWRQIDLQAFLSTKSGLIAFLTHLGKEYDLFTLMVK